MDNSYVPMRKKSCFRAGLRHTKCNFAEVHWEHLLYGVIFILDQVKQLNQAREDNENTMSDIDSQYITCSVK